MPHWRHIARQTDRQPNETDHLDVLNEGWILFFRYISHYPGFKSSVPCLLT
jgi:hypothetical protein